MFSLLGHATSRDYTETELNSQEALHTGTQWKGKHVYIWSTIFKLNWLVHACIYLEENFCAGGN